MAAPSPEAPGAELVHIREVGPRDGFQNEPEVIATADKVRLVESGDAAVVEIRVRGRHTGPLPLPDGEAPATGNEIAFDEAAVVRAAGGRIVSWHSYYDGLAFARQVGLAPAHAAG